MTQKTLNLADFQTMEAAGQDKGKVLVHGEPGTGKTTLASSIAEVCKTLYLYFPGEQGISSIPKAYRKNLYGYLAQSVEDVNDLLWQLQLGDHDFDAVVIEGAAAWQNLYARYVQGYEGARTKEQVQARAKKQVDMRRVGGDVGALLKDDLIFWFGLADRTQARPIHVILTSQSRRREIREKTTDPNAVGALIEEYIGPDVFPGIQNAVEATPDFIGHTFIEETDDLTKDDDFRYCVRFGPHELIRTKLHEDITAAKHWPAVVGRDGKRLTLPGFLRFMGALEAPKKAPAKTAAKK